METKHEMKGKNRKSQSKLLVSVLICISILFSLLTVENYAENETAENNTMTELTENEKPQENTNQVKNETTQEKVSNSTVQKTNTTNNAKTKSDNADLSDLGILPHDFSGFKSDTTSYEVTVPEDTETVEVYAKVKHEKATVIGTGIKKLEKGENKVELVVTAEDGTKKTYTINIIRGEKQEEVVEENNKVEEGNGLLELKINNLVLSPEFKTNVYEYTVKYIGEDTKLNIETKPTKEDYIVEITGNENLQEGENIITIIVSEKNGDNVATYQITVNKSLVDKEAIAREEAQKKEQQKTIIIGAVVAVIAVVIIVCIIIVRKRNRNLAEEFLGASFYHQEDEEDEEYEDNYYEDEYKDAEEKRKDKERLKEKFLNNYSSHEEKYKEENEEDIRKKHKGKRFI